MCFFGIKQKVRQPKSAHRKTQTPIVAKQVEMERGKNLLPLPISRNLHFYQILKKSVRQKKVLFLSRFRQKNTSFKIFNLSGSFIIPPFVKFVNPNRQKSCILPDSRFFNIKTLQINRRSDLECFVLFNSIYTSISNYLQSLQ